MFTSKFRPFLLNLSLLLLAFLLSIAVGGVFIPPGTITRILLDYLPGLEMAADWPDSSTVIVLSVRLPHTILIALTGAALASSGAAYQGLFRNPLADPYLIGVASGAGLGAVFVMAVRWPKDLLGYYFVTAGALVGPIITVVLV